MENSNLAFNLRLLRTSLGLFTADVQFHCNLITNKVSHLENGRSVRVLPEELQRITDFFNESIEGLNVTVEDLTEKRATIIFK